MVTAARFAPKTLTALVDLLLARRASAAQCAEALRSEVIDALEQRDVSGLFDEQERSADSDATTALMLVEGAERRLGEVEEALGRVADGSYGYCIDCGGGIPLERLRALPATARCVGCSRRSSQWSRGFVVKDHLRSTTIRGRSVGGPRQLRPTPTPGRAPRRRAP